MRAVPRDRTILANGLRHHLVEWGDGDRIVLLLHGFLEHAHVWDFAAPGIAAAGFRAVALDWRGHGDSDWIGAGGYYHFADYVADLAFLVRALGGHTSIVAHSMGASAALQYAGTEPARVAALVLVDGLGPGDSSPDFAPDRYAGWVGDLERIAARGRVAPAPDDPVARLRERFPRWPADVARHMAAHGTRVGDDGVRVWKFDALHQTRVPQPYYVAQARAFWRRIACPVLYVEGAESPLRHDDTETDDRLAILRAERATVAGAGHHPHLERPDALVDAVVPFLRRVVAL